ncbi:hypothetical protein GCM10010306_091200 [Streptomyces umbrinus]|uniref:hypothetical protein n=1 Tax=Streptomyces umbrinus TaxID=67370 RepID=UPI001678FC72|nr:hypothetical protein [Streptomyces umbrinus]GHB82375.1 hypothetical protein GCM10010306_091200 [Streptomyces umbrinus]
MTACVPTVDYMEADYDGVLVLVVCASDYGETTVATTGSKAAAYRAFNRYYQDIRGEQNCFDDPKDTETLRRRPLRHHARPGPTLAATGTIGLGGTRPSTISRPAATRTRTTSGAPRSTRNA